MTKFKATHCGCCQVCGRVQKLPNGLLAKHGYAVLGGYFEGTCYGSGHLPLEQDKSMVAKSILVTQNRIKEFTQAIEHWSVSESTSEPEGWFHEYISSNRRGIPPRYIWRRVKIEGEVKTSPEGDYKYFEGYFLGHDGKRELLIRHSLSGKSAIDVANKMNQNYIDQYLREGIQNMERYIKDQEERIRVWHLQPLRPIKEML